jgi:hypothetical protein
VFADRLLVALRPVFADFWFVWLMGIAGQKKIRSPGDWDCGFVRVLPFRRFVGSVFCCFGD